jgi:hypothetical protein
MSPNRIPPVNKRLCRAGSTLAGTTALFLIVGNAVLWLVPQWAEVAARNSANLWTEKLFITPFVQWIGFGIGTLHLCVLVWGLLSMRTLFRLLAGGEAFVAQTGFLLRRFGIALLAYAALMPIVRSAITALVTHDPVKHELVVSVGISSDEVVLALISALIIVFGSVMADATRIAEENREII